MPRRRRNTNEGAAPIQRRVRTGCRTCRERKVKCDEAKPRCRNCVQRGLTCDNGVQLKWEQEFVSRGLAFGRQGRWTKEGRRPRSSSATAVENTEWCVLPLVRPHHFVNTLFWELDPTWQARLDLPGHSRPDDAINDNLTITDELEIVPFPGAAEGSALSLLLGSPEKSSRRPTTTSTPSSSSSSSSSFFIHPPPTFPSLVLPSRPSSFPHLKGLDSSLLDYYLMRLCPLTTPSPFSPSPFAYLVVPILHMPGYEDIVQAVVSLAARHRSVSDASWTKNALTLRDGVISSLRRRLTASSQPGGSWDAQILILMMFLCLYEIVDNCDYRWVIHLRASQDVIRRSRQVQPKLLAANGDNSASCDLHLGPLTTFTERFFAFQDVISRTACENPPLFGHEYWDDAENLDYEATYGTQSSSIDTWMGCSIVLVRILSRISELSRLKARGKITAEDLELQSAQLETQLDELKQDAIPAENADPVGSSTLAWSAELKRKSVVLYLYCALYDASPATPRVAALVTDILESVGKLVAEGRTAGLSFPIFVAAVELDPLDSQVFENASTGKPIHGRRYVLEMLEAMLQCSLANVSRTKAVIQKVWRVRDMSVGEDLGEAKASTNDWGIYVGPYSNNISLA